MIPGGFGIRGTEGKINAIKYARTEKIPFLGICLGFQLVVVEFARYIGLKGANSTENDPNTEHPVVDLMPEQKDINIKGATMRLGAQEVIISPNTMAYELYKKNKVTERHRHRYEVNPNYIKRLEENGMVFSGKSPDGMRMEILEISNTPFHFATQFHGEFKSRPGRPSPSYYGFIKACLDKKRVH